MNLIETLKTKKLFIFDMDGTITDTEPCHYEAYRRTVETLCKGHTMEPLEFLRDYVGHPETEIYQIMREKKGVSIDDDLFFKTRIDNLFDVVRERGLTTAPFYRQLEGLFPNTKFITLTSQRTVVLNRFMNYIDYGKIEKFISVADVGYGKGEVLADTVNYLGYEQCDCVIFEDFAPTLHKAMENGVTAVGVTHDFNAITNSDCDFLIDIHKEI